VNHYYFRTYALDLGLYTNAAFKYAHFQLADCNVIKEFPETLLGGHFDLYLIIFSPLIFLFGTYTLLIVQIFFLISGGVGVYKYFQLIENNDRGTPILAAVYFYSFFGVYGALSFDYHSVVVAASVVPWFFIAVRNNNKLRSVILLIFMLVSQENVSLWLVFICLGLVYEYRRDRGLFLYLLLLAGISLLYFLMVIFFVIPSFSATNEYGGFLYSYLGKNAFEAVKTLICHPIDSLWMLFTNHNHSPHGDFVKAELHIILLLSGLPILIFKPQYILMMLPVYFQKLFHDNYTMWGIGGQYSIEFGPIMAIGIFKVVSEVKIVRVKRVMTFMIMFFVIASTMRTMDNTVLYTNKSRIRFYKKSHYQRDYDVALVHRQLREIPQNARVSAQAPFVPHLALRSGIYQFPIVKDADYIVYSKHEDSYPVTQEEFNSKMDSLLRSEHWKKLINNEIIILKRLTQFN
jgi:uncharacterized membrane protein